MEDEATVKLKISNLKSYLKLNGKAMFGEGTTAYCEIEKGFCKIKYSHEEEVPGGPDESTCDLLNIPPPPVCVATGSPNCTPYLNYGSPALHQGHPGYISEIYWHMMASQQGYAKRCCSSRLEIALLLASCLRMHKNTTHMSEATSAHKSTRPFSIFQTQQRKIMTIMSVCMFSFEATLHVFVFDGIGVIVSLNHGTWSFSALGS